MGKYLRDYQIPDYNEDKPKKSKWTKKFKDQEEEKSLTKKKFKR